MEVSVESLEFLRRNAVITAAGSITSVPVNVNNTDVNVTEFGKDDVFNEKGFGDIAF